MATDWSKLAPNDAIYLGSSFPFNFSHISNFVNLIFPAILGFDFFLLEDIGY